jgi:hypothetical protein
MLHCTAIVITFRYNIGMPNAPKTPTRTLRVDDELWTAVQAQAKLDGVTVTSIIIDGLLSYLKNARIESNSVVE